MARMLGQAPSGVTAMEHEHDFRHSDRRGDDRPDPRDGGQTLADWVVLVPRENLRFELSDSCLDIFDLADDHPRP